MKVFLTVDTEIWPETAEVFDGDPHSRPDLRPAMAAYLDGHTARGDFGLGFQLRLLEQHGLRATYFVESLFSCVAGPEALRAVVGRIRAAGQDVQLHVHPEWLALARVPGLPAVRRPLLRQYPEPEQAAIIAHGAELLRDAGADAVCAFRAGSFGADAATLRALAKNGIALDTSLSPPYLGDACDFRLDHPGLQPFDLEDVLEVPITCFEDWPGHRRPLQLGSCSSGEIETVLWAAARAGWRAAVLLMHSAECVRRVRGMAETGVAQPSSIVVKRFERLCRFLSTHRDTFEMATFADAGALELRGPQPGDAPASTVPRTLWRYAEQLCSRFA